MPRSRKAPPAAPRAFRSAAAFRAWLERHHATVESLDLKLFKVAAKSRGMGYAEALEEALCFGWIDGVRRALDDVSFAQRFSPRKKGSRWSLVNIRHAKRLEAGGRMRPAGLAAFHARDENDSRRYSFETRPVELPPALGRKFRANSRAWRFFQSQPAGYRRLFSFRVVSAKKPETRERRLAELIAWCAAERPLREWLRPAKKEER